MPNQPPSRRGCVISLAINSPQPADHPGVEYQDYARGITRLRTQLYDVHAFGGDVLFWDTDYPPGSPTMREAHSAFKPFCFAEAFRQGHDLILWLDASIVVKRPLEPLFQSIQDVGYLVYPNTHSVGEYCKDEALAPLGITREESFALRSCMATVIGLDLTHPVSRTFLDQWKALAADGVTFPGPKWSGVRGWPRVASQDPRVKGHRYDQTAASVLFMRLGMTRWSSRRQFYDYFDIDRLFVRKLHEEYEPAAAGTNLADQRGA